MADRRKRPAYVKRTAHDDVADIYVALTADEIRACLSVIPPGERTRFGRTLRAKLLRLLRKAEEQL